MRVKGDSLKTIVIQIFLVMPGPALILGMIFCLIATDDHRDEGVTATYTSEGGKYIAEVYWDVGGGGVFSYCFDGVRIQVKEDLNAVPDRVFFEYCPARGLEVKDSVEWLNDHTLHIYPRG
ncbi:hypothetical protein [Pseudomonas japonica]|uniref:hypothetical protein n=1 Tax=Pseudomonas japonica TaxID=256466 RepID=UPI0015E2F87A|nr:hypothetical protein [Pseudomonas japonica]MBA1290960.1 hypothetical protein [Pseudomonas japonica]